MLVWSCLADATYQATLALRDATPPELACLRMRILRSCYNIIMTNKMYKNDLQIQCDCMSVCFKKKLSNEFSIILFL